MQLLPRNYLFLACVYVWDAIFGMEISPVEYALFPDESELTLSLSALEPVELEIIALCRF